MRALDTLIHGAGDVVTTDGSQPEYIGVVDGKFVYLGPADALEAAGFERAPTTSTVDARGGLVLPGLVDCHTHLVFGGDRSGEYALRARGADYLEIAEAGGGIASTMRATRAASDDALVESALPRLRRLISGGVTTVEIKSGYGLDLASELKMLRVAKRVGALAGVDVIATFLGAHTIPPDRRARRAEHVDEIVQSWIPAVAEQGIARFCDVFVERGAFTLAEAERILRAGLDHGLRPKLHVDQLSAGGGAELAAKLGAVSADHLEHISADGIHALAAAGTVAVLLPGATMFLGETARAPARRLLDAGVKVALSTDCNPGTSMTENLPLMTTLGMSLLGMSPDEVIAGVTSSAAAALDLGSTAGRIEVGRAADLVIFDAPSRAHLPYRFGAQLTRLVLKGGRAIYEPAP